LPIDFEVRPDEGLVIFTVKGGFTAEDFIAAIDEAAEEPGWRPAMDALFDMTDGVGDLLSPDALKRMARFMWNSTPKLGAGYKVAVVAKRDVDYGLTRMFQVFMNGPPFELRIFRDRGEALGWLG
jgi:hypothetical protein